MMSQTDLPAVVSDYIEASNRHDVKGYVNTFSEHAVIEEDSLGRNLQGRQEIASIQKTNVTGTIGLMQALIDYTIASIVSR